MTVAFADQVLMMSVWCYHCDAMPAQCWVTFCIFSHGDTMLKYADTPLCPDCNDYLWERVLDEGGLWTEHLRGPVIYAIREHP